jgi:hypothetical protein
MIFALSTPQFVSIGRARLRPEDRRADGCGGAGGHRAVKKAAERPRFRHERARRPATDFNHSCGFSSKKAIDDKGRERCSRSEKLYAQFAGG